MVRWGISTSKREDPKKKKKELGRGQTGGVGRAGSSKQEWHVGGLKKLLGRSRMQGEGWQKVRHNIAEEHGERQT